MQLVIQEPLQLKDNKVEVRDCYILGRGNDCQIQYILRDLSRKHAQFLHNPELERWYVQDLDSLNGLYVNGEKVNFAALDNGDSIRCGSLLMIVEE